MRVPEEWYTGDEDGDTQELSHGFWEYIRNISEYYDEYDALDAPIEIAPKPPSPSLQDEIEQEIADRFRGMVLYEQTDWVKSLIQIGLERTEPDYTWNPNGIEDIDIR